MAFSGVHHAAFISNNMKAQIEFYTQVLGMKLVGLFPMHGVEGASHCFIEAGKDSYVSFVQIKDVNVEPVLGISHAADVSGPVAGGAMQHIAFKCDSVEEMLQLRDRLRSHGYAVFGPLEHGMSHSMYFAGPEGMLLEFATTDQCEPVRPEDWVDPGAAAEVGISQEELNGYVNPPAFEGQGGKVPQPPAETAVYPTPIPKPMFDQLGYLSDEQLREAMRFAQPASE